MYGFVVLDDINVDGFAWQDHRLGSVALRNGDAFVLAPDGSRAGLVWEVCDPPYFQETMRIEADRWGVRGVGFRLPMNSRENARRNLESILPELRLGWAEWKSRSDPTPQEWVAAERISFKLVSVLDVRK